MTRGPITRLDIAAPRMQIRQMLPPARQGGLRALQMLWIVIQPPSLLIIQLQQRPVPPVGFPIAAPVPPGSAAPAPRGMTG